jgi:predicted nucleotidyltransferase
MAKRSSSSARIVYPPFDLEGLLARLREGVQTLAGRLPLIECVLFGSWASGRATAFSDIDLLVVHSGQARKDAFETVRKAIPLRGLEPHVFSEEEARTLRTTIDRMIRSGIPIDFGVKDDH